MKQLVNKEMVEFFHKQTGTLNEKAQKTNKEFKVDFNESAYRKSKLNSFSNQELEKVASATAQLTIQRKLKALETKELHKLANEIALTTKLQEVKEQYSPFIDLKDVTYKFKNSETIIFYISDLHYDGDEELHSKALSVLLSKMVAIVKKFGIKNVIIKSLGDQMDGMLRPTDFKNKAYLIQQAKWVSEAFAKLFEELHFKTGAKITVFYTTDSNHPQIRLHNTKEGELKNENMENIIAWYLETYFKDHKHITIVPGDQKLGGAIVVKLNGSNYLLTHGQQVNKSPRYIQSFESMHNIKINFMITGHFHHYKCETINSGIDENGNPVNKKYFCCPGLLQKDKDYATRINLSSEPAFAYSFLEENGMTTPVEVLCSAKEYK